jgi:hypothetical protein
VTGYEPNSGKQNAKFFYYKLLFKCTSINFYIELKATIYFSKAIFIYLKFKYDFFKYDIYCPTG